MSSEQQPFEWRATRQQRRQHEIQVIQFDSGLSGCSSQNRNFYNWMRRIRLHVRHFRIKIPKIQIFFSLHFQAFDKSIINLHPFGICGSCCGTYRNYILVKLNKFFGSDRILWFAAAIFAVQQTTRPSQLWRRVWSIATHLTSAKWHEKDTNHSNYNL